MPPLIHPATGLMIADPEQAALTADNLPSHEAIKQAVGDFILSASGWRSIFAVDSRGNLAEDSRNPQVKPAQLVVIASAASVFAAALKRWVGKPEPTVIIGLDARPTGPAIADIITRLLLAEGCRPYYCFIISAPEIMAFARSDWSSQLVSADGKPLGPEAWPDAFIYITASHNPIGHNGLKFGLTDGGVLSGEAAAELLTDFKQRLNLQDLAEKSLELSRQPSAKRLTEVYLTASDWKNRAYSSYRGFIREVISGSAEPDSQALIFDDIRAAVKAQPLGVLADFNGSARCLGPDAELLTELGLEFASINDQVGRIVHRIVPEGDALEASRQALEVLHAKNPAYQLAYSCDCDGDRGNLVIWDDQVGHCRPLEAQEVFALSCLAELAFFYWRQIDQSVNQPATLAVVVNDPTSARIDDIARAFQAEVFRAEVGEANVVGLARELRQQGRQIPILGEGSAGGNITHPSAVRDPLATVFALVKLLTLRSTDKRPGLFEIWCQRSKQPTAYRPRFTLADIIASLPSYTTTSAYEAMAGLKINSRDHGALKAAYEKLFRFDWQQRQADFKARFGIVNWRALAYNGRVERPLQSGFEAAGKGGLKLLFEDREGRMVASLWMRGSGTEPIFRVMAEVTGQRPEVERELLDWHRSMIQSADKILSRRQGEN